MNRLLSILSLAYVLVAHADTIVTDFSQPIDPSQWETRLPYDGSTFTAWGAPQDASRIKQGQTGINLINRAMLSTAMELTMPYAVSGSFTMLSECEHFNIALRTDMSITGICSELTGVIVTFTNDGNGISIEEYGTDQDGLMTVNQIATTGRWMYDLRENRIYDFSISDDGFNISLDVNGINLLNTTSFFGTGDHLAAYSREFGDGTILHDASITFGAPPPEMQMSRMMFVAEAAPSVSDSTSTLGLMIGGLLASLLLRLRRFCRIALDISAYSVLPYSLR